MLSSKQLCVEEVAKICTCCTVWKFGCGCGGKFPIPCKSATELLCMSPLPKNPLLRWEGVDGGDWNSLVRRRDSVASPEMSLALYRILKLVSMPDEPEILPERFRRPHCSASQSG